MKNKTYLFLLISLMCLTINGQVPTKGLLAYYLFSGNANDASGNGINGTVNGATLTMDRFGNENSAYYFDGIGDNINLGTPSSMQFAKDSVFTISTWINVSKNSNPSTIISYGNYAYNLYVQTNFQTNKCYLMFAAAKVANSGSTANLTSIDTNTWYHIVLVNKVGSYVKIFINGTLRYFSGFTYTYSYSQNLNIGYSDNEGLYFKGKIDDCSIYRRELSVSEIKSLAGSNKNISSSYFGTTKDGGDYNNGVIFKGKPGELGHRVVYSFNEADGKNPFGGLVQASNGKLYGMTYNGGTDNVGVLYEFDPLEEKYTKKVDFDESNGSLPTGELVQSLDGNLYGMTLRGGNWDRGILFRYNTNNNSLTKIWDFDGTDGAFPYGSLIQASDGFLYGMTSEGGDYKKGTIFKFSIDDSSLTRLVSFDSTVIGYGPRGDLTEFAGKLFGVAYLGGSNNNGVLFEYNMTTGICTKRVDFENVSKGRFPYGTLTLGNNNKFYGLTYMGGINNDGVLFEYDPSTYTFTKKIELLASNTGENSMTSLMQASNGNIYGLSTQGGYYGYGILYEYDLFNNTISIKSYFDEENGAIPFKSRLLEVQSSVYPKDGLVVYYMLNNNSADSSSNKMDGTNYGGVPTQDRFGNTNTAYAFNGTNQYIAMPPFSYTYLQFTFTCWIKTTESASNSIYWNRPCIFGNSTSNSASYDFGITTNNGYLGMWSGMNSKGDNSTISGYRINDDQWHHIVCTYDHDSIKLYLDGQDIKCALSADTVLTSYANYLMAQHHYSGSANYFHQGVLDEVKFYNRVLNREEMNYLYGNNCKSAFPKAQDESRIGQGNLKLVATGGENYRWFNSNFNGDLIGSDSVFNTSYLAESDTFWVANYDGCESARKRVIANICLPEDGLVAYYPFSGNTNDYSGHNLNGTAFGAGYVPDQFGNQNSAVSLMKSDTILVPQNNLLDITETITLCAWIKVAKFNNCGGIITYGSKDHEIYSLSTSSSGNVFFQTNWPGKVYNLYSTALDTGKWYNVVASFNNGETKIYINGELNAAAALDISEFALSENRFLTIGMSQPGAAEYFNGNVDEVRIYNRVLTDAEINLIYSNACLSSKVIVNAGADINTNQGSKITLTATGNANSFSWNNGVLNGAEFTADNSQTYIVTASDINTCIGSDTVLVSVSVIIPVDETEGKNLLRLYPTISNSTIHIEESGIAINSITVLNLNGQVMYSSNSGFESIDVSNLPEGIYVVRIETNCETYSRRIIKK